MELYYKIWTYVLAGVLGLCVGSFLNVLIYRLPRGMNIAKPGSHCTTCDYVLKWYDNIPVLSYIMLGGKCRKCRQPISPRYTIVEIVNCLLWLLCVFWFYDTCGIITVICSCVALSAMMVAFFTDFECMMVPDSITITIALAALVLTISGECGVNTGVESSSRLWGCAFSLAFFGLFYFGYLLLRGHEGLGFGDVKLMGALGLLLGLANSVLCIGLSCVLAVVSRLFCSKTRERLPLCEDVGEFAFAPFIVFAALFCLFYGNTVCDWYLGLIVF